MACDSVDTKLLVLRDATTPLRSTRLHVDFSLLGPKVAFSLRREVSRIGICQVIYLGFHVPIMVCFNSAILSRSERATLARLASSSGFAISAWLMTFSEVVRYPSHDKEIQFSQALRVIPGELRCRAWASRPRGD